MTEIKLENGKVVVYENGVYMYSVAASHPAINMLGNETGNSWSQEFEAENIFVWDDGEISSLGGHGSLYALK
jgi:hypothetical protein